jgi:hypothetical protein
VLDPVEVVRRGRERFAEPRIVRMQAKLVDDPGLEVLDLLRLRRATAFELREPRVERGAAVHGLGHLQLQRAAPRLALEVDLPDVGLHLVERVPDRVRAQLGQGALREPRERRFALLDEPGDPLLAVVDAVAQRRLGRPFAGERMADLAVDFGAEDRHVTTS